MINSSGPTSNQHLRQPLTPRNGNVPHQTRLESLISDAYNNRDLRSPKRRRTEENTDQNQTNNVNENSWAIVTGRNQSHQSNTQRSVPSGQIPKIHWRQKSLIANGSCDTNKDDKSFAADVCLVAGGVSKNATCEKLTDYLKNKGLAILNCELLTNPMALDKVRSLSFKVTIKAEDLEKASDPSIWPYRVAVSSMIYNLHISLNALQICVLG